MIIKKNMKMKSRKKRMELKKKRGIEKKEEEGMS